MPESQHPPYGVGSVPPRQLNRWLDVNSQNGQLTRTRGYVSLPAFNIPSAGRSYSEIVGVYSYEATNNFSIKNYRNFTNDGSYSLCIAYANSDLSVVRYLLVRGNSDNNLSYPPMYAGQKIKKNFRLEIWDGIDHVNCINENIIQMFSTVLGSLDYRYGLDFVLGNSSILCTSQANTNNSVVLNPPQANLQLWLTANAAYVDLDGSGNVTNWRDRSINAFTLTQTNPAFRGAFQEGFILFLGKQYLTVAAPLNITIVELFILLTVYVGGANTNHIIRIFNGIPESIILTADTANDTFRVNFVSGAGIVESLFGIAPFSDSYKLDINTDGSGIISSDGRTGIVKNSGTVGVSYSITPSPVIVVGEDSVVGNSFGCFISAILCYSTNLSDANRALVNQYLATISDGGLKYNSPLTFAPCTILTPNT